MKFIFTLVSFLLAAVNLSASAATTGSFSHNNLRRMAATSTTHSNKELYGQLLNELDEHYDRKCSTFKDDDAGYSTIICDDRNGNSLKIIVVEDERDGSSPVHLKGCSFDETTSERVCVEKGTTGEIYDMLQSSDPNGDDEDRKLCACTCVGDHCGCKFSCWVACTCG